MATQEMFDDEQELLERSHEAAADDYDGDEPDESGFEESYEFHTPTGLSRNADRYIFWAGNLMTDAVRESRPDFRLGGEYFGQDFPGLVLSRFVLHRARITPITLQPRHLSRDEQIVNKTVEIFEGEIKADGVSPRVQFAKAFPGDQVETIVFGARDGKSKGIVELTGFQKMPWREKETRRIVVEVQNKIFPHWKAYLAGEKALPERLREIEGIISEAQDKYASDALISKTTKEMLSSCRQFRLYGVGYLQREGVRIRAGVHGQGYVHQYSEVAEVLLRQLEMKRENLLEERQPAPPPPQIAPADNSALIESNNRLADAYLELAESNRAKAGEDLRRNRDQISVALGGSEALPTPSPEQLKRVSVESLTKEAGELNITFPENATKAVMWGMIEAKKAETQVSK